jgi:hypothetical protein
VVFFKHNVLSVNLKFIYFFLLYKNNVILGDSFNELQRISGSSDDLVDQLVKNSQCQKVLALNGENLLSNKKFIFKILFQIKIKI